MKMNYFVFGTNNMSDAIKFYDAIFIKTKITKTHAKGRMTLWSGPDFMFALAEPFDGKTSTNGNGTMLGFNLDSDDQVIQLYEKALALGGTSEGKPDVRSGRYCAYIRDLDNNKICFYK